MANKEQLFASNERNQITLSHSPEELIALMNAMWSFASLEKSYDNVKDDQEMWQFMNFWFEKRAQSKSD